MKWFAPALLIAPALAAAQDARPLDFDSRIETLEWSEGRELGLRTTVGGALTVIFAPGEAIQSVVVGDPGAAEVQVAPQADSLLLRTYRSPTNPTVEVRTQLRQYRFRLEMGPPNDVAYAIRFSIGSPPVYQPAAELPPEGSVNAYAVKGDAALRPRRVSDDGTRTYIEWGEDQALPAVFAINALGEEETVDSYIRQEVMVIDRVYPRLIFRIGKMKAQANRAVGAKPR